MSALKESEIYKEGIIREIGKMNLKPLTIELHGFVSKMSSYLRRIKTPTENDLEFVRQFRKMIDNKMFKPLTYFAKIHNQNSRFGSEKLNNAFFNVVRNIASGKDALIKAQTAYFATLGDTLRKEKLTVGAKKQIIAKLAKSLKFSVEQAFIISGLIQRGDIQLASKYNSLKTSEEIRRQVERDKLTWTQDFLKVSSVFFATVIATTLQQATNPFSAGVLDKSLQQQQQSEFIAAIGLANMMDKLMEMNKEQKKLLEKMQEEMEKRKKAA